MKTCELLPYVPFASEPTNLHRIITGLRGAFYTRSTAVRSASVIHWFVMIILLHVWCISVAEINGTEADDLAGYRLANQPNKCATIFNPIRKPLQKHHVHKLPSSEILSTNPSGSLKLGSSSLFSLLSCLVPSLFWALLSTSFFFAILAIPCTLRRFLWFNIFSSVL